MFQGDSTYHVNQTSRLHFEIYRQDDETYIKDKSGNGTFVQGMKLIKDNPRVLEHGDTVAVLCGDIDLFLFLVEEERKFPLQYLVGKAVGGWLLWTGL